MTKDDTEGLLWRAKGEVTVQVQLRSPGLHVRHQMLFEDSGQCLPHGLEQSYGPEVRGGISCLTHFT